MYILYISYIEPMYRSLYLSKPMEINYIVYKEKY